MDLVWNMLGVSKRSLHARKRLKPEEKPEEQNHEYSSTRLLMPVYLRKQPIQVLRQRDSLKISKVVA
jgi:hypothetical protein